MTQALASLLSTLHLTMQLRVGICFDLGKRGETPPCCESGSRVALRFSAREKILIVSQWIHLRFFPALKIKHQPYLHFLATGRFRPASLGKTGETPPCCESGSRVALRFSAREKILNVSQWIHLRFFPALKIKYQPYLHFLATGRFCLASLEQNQPDDTLRAQVLSDAPRGRQACPYSRRSVIEAFDRRTPASRYVWIF